MFATDINEFLGFMSTKGADGTRPAANEGHAITPGTGGVMGSYVDLGVLSSTHDVLEFDLVVHTVVVPASNRQVSIDLAIDTTGAGSYASNGSQNLISDLLCGSPGQIAGGTGLPSVWHWTVRVPAGASVGVRGSTLDATTTAFRVFINASYQPTRPEVVPVGSFVQTFGVGTPGTVAGTTIVPGTTSDGSWVEIGTADKPLFYLEFGYVINDTTMSNGHLEIDIAVGDATEKRVVIPNALMVTVSNETMSKRTVGRVAHVAPGQKIYARSQHSVTPDDANSVAVYGVG